jgi:N-acetylmuramic acid 6-phosphate etherase
MVDAQATNQKLVTRAIRIVCTSTGVSEQKAEEALKRCGFSCKTAIVMLLLNVEAPEAESLLAASDGRIARAIENGREG